MKKFFTLIATALIAVSASAQDLSLVKLFTKDGNSYKLPSTAQEIADFKAAYPDNATLFWGVDPAFPADVALNEDQTDLVISGVTTVNVGTQFNLVKEYQKVKAYINCGSSLGNTINPETDITEDPAGWDAGNSQSILRVVTKKAGKLEFDVYSGTNNRSIGIYQTPTDEELDNEITGKWLDVQSYSDTEPNILHTTSATVEAGREYILVCSSSKANQNLMEIRFDTTNTGSGIENVEVVEGAKVAPKKVFKNGQIMIGDFNIAGQRVK